MRRGAVDMGAAQPTFTQLPAQLLFLSPTLLLVLVLLLLLVQSSCPIAHAAPSARVAEQLLEEAHAREAAVRNSSFAVFGYLPEYRQANFPYEEYFSRGLTHLIFFSLEVDPVTLRLSHAEDRLPRMGGADGGEWAKVRAAADRYGVKLLVSIGGGGRSAGFAPLVAQNSARRASFIEELSNLLLRRGLDGVDFNWEYPQSSTEWQQFGQFLREARSRLGYVTVPMGLHESEEGIPPCVLLERWRVGHRQGTIKTSSKLFDNKNNQLGQEEKSAGAAAAATRSSSSSASTTVLKRVRARPMIFTMALHPHPAIAGILQAHRILPTLDYLHWMAYDHMSYGTPHSSVAYAEAVLRPAYLRALDDAAASSSSFNRQKMASVQQQTHKLGQQLVDHRRKLTLGIPLYGRHSTEPRREPETYSRLIYFIKQWAGKRHVGWTDTTQELRDMSEYGGYFYNGYTDVKRKMQLARSALQERSSSGSNGNSEGIINGIAGVMVWELGQDLMPPSAEPLSLMNAVHEQLLEWGIIVTDHGGGGGGGGAMPPTWCPEEDEGKEEPKVEATAAATAQKIEEEEEEEGTDGDL